MPVLRKVGGDKSEQKLKSTKNLNKIEIPAFAELASDVINRVGEPEQKFTDFQIELAVLARMQAEETNADNVVKIANSVIKTYWGVYFAMMYDFQD